MLAGVVKKNGIIMVDFALQLRREKNLAPRNAIIEACLVRSTWPQNIFLRGRVESPNALAAPEMSDITKKAHHNGAQSESGSSTNAQRTS